MFLAAACEAEDRRVEVTIVFEAGVGRDDEEILVAGAGAEDVDECTDWLIGRVFVLCTVEGLAVTVLADE